MKFHPRTQLAAVLLLAAAAAAHAADAFPSRPIRIIVNSGAGALLDVTTRVIAQEMSQNLGQPVIVENRTGADGVIGIRAVKTAAPDGYTLLATANTLAQLPAFKKEPGYDPVKDFAGIGILSQAPFIMVGSTSLPSKNLADLIARAKANPDKMQYASGGFGTSTQWSGSESPGSRGRLWRGFPWRRARRPSLSDGHQRHPPRAFAPPPDAYGIHRYRRRC